MIEEQRRDEGVRAPRPVDVAVVPVEVKRNDSRVRVRKYSIEYVNALSRFHCENVRRGGTTR